MSRSPKKRTLAIAALVLWLGTCINPASAQEKQAQKDAELSERHRRVELMMAELEAKFEILAAKLEEKEPERAKRLIEALQQAKEKLIKRNMADVTTLLQQQKYDEAEQVLNSVILNLDELVRLLLNDKDAKMNRQEEIDKLKEWRDKIQQIQKEQKKQTRETDKVANKDDTLKDLQKQIQAVQDLIKKQQEVIVATDASKRNGIKALDGVADKQYKVRKDTEDLAKKLGGETDEEKKPEDDKEPNSDSKAGGDGKKGSGDKKAGGKSGGKKGDEKKAGDKKGGDSKSGDPKGGDSKSGGQKSGGQKSGGKKSGGKKSGGQKSGGQKSGQQSDKQPGQQPLEDAAKKQQEAEQKLAEGKAATAKRAEEKALAELNKALNELKKEQRRIASLPPEAFQKMAKEQRRTKNKTEDLAKDMKNSPKGGDQKGGGGDPKGGQAGQQQKQQPGQQSVQRAQKAMQEAAEDLSEQEAQRAARKQQKAEEELEKALREIEERLDQLREETREEKLARLEARFREMLARQQFATVMTMDLDDKKKHLGKLRRRDLLTMLRLSTEEIEISELGQQAYDLLLEDGTSIVFPEMVQQIRDDLGRVAGMLEAEQTGALTQLVQREIESSIEEMLEALKQTRKNREGGGGGGGGGGGDQPLLQKSAELKMLRAAQLRVNRLTKQFDLIRPDGKLGEALRGELGNIRTRQSEIVEMMIRIMEKQ